MISKKIKLPRIPEYATNNAHIFYLICRSKDERSKLISHLQNDGILAVFHYISLHKSPFYISLKDNRVLANADFYTENLLRLPLFYDLTKKEQMHIINSIMRFYNL